MYANEPVNHRAVLGLFHLLKSVDPTATVNGNKETARINGLVFTLELAGGHVVGEYYGFHLRVISPTAGILDTTTLNLREFNIVTSTKGIISHTISPHTVGNLTNGVATAELETAVRDHVRAFAGTAR